MNKKFLICSAIAMGLLLTACVKKEAPKEDEQVEVEASEPVELQPLEKPTEIQAEPQVVQIERSETENTTTEITRSTQPAEANPTTASPAQEEPSTPKTQSATVGSDSPKPSTSRSKDAQSEDDAVAAAIAAATPALDK